MSNMPWSPEQDRILKKYASRKDKYFIAEKTQRPVTSVEARARRLKISLVVVRKRYEAVTTATVREAIEAFNKCGGSCTEAAKQLKIGYQRCRYLVGVAKRSGIGC